MTLLLAAAAGLVAFRLLARIQKLELAVERVMDRLNALESSGPIAARQQTTTVERPTAAPPTRPAPTADHVPLTRPSASPIAVPVPPAAPIPVPPPQPAAYVPTPPSAAARRESSGARVEGSERANRRVEGPALSELLRPRVEGLESRIGSRWLLYIGVVAIIIGVSYFEKLAIENHWVGETARVIQGTVAGFVLVAVGLQFVRKGFRLYGQVLSGAGVAVLYVSIYAAFNFYHLIGQTVAFGLMSAVTGLAAWLADRQRSQSLALVAVGGGFATPFLLPSPHDAQIALFGYETFLVAGTMYLSRRRDWPTLNVVSYAFTAVTFGAWAAQFYTPTKYLPTEAFLTLFCGMYLFILRETRHSQRASAHAERLILGTAPFAYYLASLAVLWPHFAALLIYLVVLAFVGVASTVGRRSELRLAFWLAAAAPLLFWSSGNAGAWLAAGLATWTAVYSLNLAGLLKATLGGDSRFTPADIALLHLNGLTAFAGVYVLIEPSHLASAAPLAAGFALLHGALSGITWKVHREEALHFAALAFTLLTIAIALEFDGASMTSAWAAEGAVVMWLGLRERREWLRRCGLFLFGVAIVRLLALQFSDPRVGQMLILNRRAAAGAFVVALTYLLAVLHHRLGAPARRATRTGIALVAAKLLLLAAAASEIDAYWTVHYALPFVRASQVVIAALIAGTAAIWMALVRRQEWMRSIGGAIVALAAFALFSLQIEPAPVGYVTLLNTRAMAGLFAIGVLYAIGALHRRLGTHIPDPAANLAVIITGASLLSLSLLTSEINAYWAARGAAAAWSMSRESLHAIAYAGVGGFLVWHGLSNRRTWVRALGGALVAVGVLRLLTAQFAVAQPGYVVLANPRTVASAVVVVLLYGLARLYRDADDVPETQYSAAAVLLLAAHALTLTLLTSEITAYWHVHDVRLASRAASATSHFAREMMLSITWALYATLLIIVGLEKRYAPIRYFAMSVFVVTIVKVFAIDLAELDRIYRVLSVIGLGVTLLVTSYLYQRTRDAGS